MVPQCKFQIRSRRDRNSCGHRELIFDHVQDIAKCLLAETLNHQILASGRVKRPWHSFILLPCRQDKIRSQYCTVLSLALVLCQVRECSMYLSSCPWGSCGRPRLPGAEEEKKRKWRVKTRQYCWQYSIDGKRRSQTAQALRQRSSRAATFETRWSLRSPAMIGCHRSGHAIDDHSKLDQVCPLPRAIAEAPPCPNQSPCRPPQVRCWNTLFSFYDHIGDGQT